MKNTNKYRHLSFEERFLIDRLHRAMVAIREIAKFLKRSPNTISREINKNSTKGEYEAQKANKKARFKRWRSKRQCLKVAMDRFLLRFVEEKLRNKWSPEQISGYLKTELRIRCSTKAIYKFAESRGLEYLLFWGWNNQKRGLKKYKYDNPKDKRKYIDLRPIAEGVGHFEVDFIVSKQSSFVFLVAVDRITKKTFMKNLPNRKRTTILGAFSELFGGTKVKSITTDNDIAFVCWKEIEALLSTQIYFTYPYHSWEKGLVENTNRWVRCFISKRRDIQSVTEEERQEILSFLNDRPRKIIEFKSPTIYHYQLTSYVS